MTAEEVGAILEAIDLYEALLDKAARQRMLGGAAGRRAWAREATVALPRQRRPEPV